MAGSLAANLMDSVWRILKQIWEHISFLDQLKPAIPLRGRIRISLSWDFQGDK
jgi:hypothetical protein